MGKLLQENIFEQLTLQKHTGNVTGNNKALIYIPSALILYLPPIAYSLLLLLKFY